MVENKFVRFLHTTNNDKKVKNHYTFFTITFIWSWGMWLLPIIRGLPINNPVMILFYVCGGIAPSATGIILAKRKGDSYLRSFLKRSLDIRLIKPGFYLFIFLVIPVTTFSGLLLHYSITGLWPQLKTLDTFLENPLSIIPFMFLMLIFGPIPEELGWRGYALDHLEQSYSKITASVILGFFWMMWHLPLFFIHGTYQNQLMHPSLFLMIDFMIQFYPLSIMMD